MLADERLGELADRLSVVGGIVGVALGGSRARGTHTASSDVDLGLYYRGDVDIAALQSLADDVGDEPPAVTGRGEWGPWVDGGAWLRIDGIAVDWIYRDLDRVRAAWVEACHGRYGWHYQTGHPLGFPDFAYVGEIAMCRVLADPTGEVAGISRSARHYPAVLGDAVRDRSLREARFCVQIAGKAIDRQDTAYVAGCLFRAVLLCAHAIHAAAGAWVVNEKGAVAAAGHLPTAPGNFSRCAHQIMAGLGTTRTPLSRAVADAGHLVEAVTAGCQPRTAG